MTTPQEPESMVERLIKVFDRELHAAALSPPAADGTIIRINLNNLARAALEALKEPTEAMETAGAISLSLLDPDERALPEGEELWPFYRRLIRPSFTAMINTALEGGK